ncbi:monocarboxylate transporter 12-like isoform X1 [Mytilus trossulus]|uniref:monocarboxylate transporter 12-like isoform X1 n=2 Tax=Mytilus trossulus TaxID=6551 RepID=UPI003004D7BD
MKNSDVDHGYAWIVLFFCSVNYFIIAGGVKSFGVLYTELLDRYDDGAGNTAWISSVNSFLMMGLGPISNYLGEIYSYRFIMVIGSIVNLIGYTASAFVTRMEYLYITYGIISGTGYGLMFAPSTTIVSFYFEKRRSLANGIVVSVSGIGAFAFPYLIRLLVDTYGLNGTFLIMGGIYFHTCAASLFLIQPAHFPYQKKKSAENHAIIKRKPDINVCSSFHKILMRMFKPSLFRNPKFTIYLMAMFLQVANFASNELILPGQTRALGFGKESITVAVSLVRASEIFARAFLGWFADLNIVKRVHLFMMCSFVSGLTPFFMPFLPYLPAIYTYAVIVGSFSGSFWSLMGVLIIDCIGIKNYSPAFGLMSLINATAFCISQPFSGWLDDTTGSWSASYYFTGVLSILSFLSCLMVPLVERIWCFNLKEHDNNLESHEVKIEESVCLYKENHSIHDLTNNPVS